MFQTSQNLPENVHSSAREIWKRIKCFPSTPHRRKLKRTNHRSFWIWAWVKLPSGEITWSLFLRSSVFNWNVFRPYWIQCPGFSKAPFAWRISVDGSLSGRTQFSRALLLMWFSARTRIAKTKMSSIERSFYLFKTRTFCAIFLYYWTQCIDAFILLL